MRLVKKNLKKNSLKSEQLTYCTQMAVNRRPPAVSNTDSVGNRKPDGDDNEDKMCSPSCKLRRAAEFFSNLFL